MKKEHSANEEAFIVTSDEITAKKAYYKNRMLQEEKVKAQLCQILLS